MEPAMYCLLTDPLIPVRFNPSAEDRNLSLPEILSALSQGADFEFISARPHQFYPWYAFLVQLASMTMHQSNQTELPTDPAIWKSLLLNMAQGQSEAFSLVVPDLSKPAFMQPPVPERSLSVLKNRIDYPDVLDVLVTAKNHDLKIARMAHPGPDHWIYSLIALQTTEGFLGAKKYGIIRMNGGFASRPFVGFAPSLLWSLRFIRDVAILLENRDMLVQQYDYKNNHGKTLLWLDPWDGTTSLKLSDCDPYYIEICRRIRLVYQDDCISAQEGNTQRQRICEPNVNGNTGDPWTPVNRTDQGKALNIGPSGYHYALTAQLLFHGDFQAGMCQILQPNDTGDIMFSGYALARKQGGTQGIHERIFPIPPKAKKLLGNSIERNTLGKMAQLRIDIVKVWTKNILRPALCSLLQGGPEKLNMKDKRSKKWETSLDRSVDDIFFEELWMDMDIAEEKATQNWLNRIYNLARIQLEDAIRECPLHNARYYRSITAAERLFYGTAHKKYPELFQIKGENNNVRQSGSISNK